MSLILHIESSTEVCSVALSLNGISKGHLTTAEGQRHSKMLAPFTRDLLASNGYEYKDLNAVALSAGPGSYTGLRVGCSTAKGICYGADISLISVSTLHSLAQEFFNQEYDLIIPTIDARRMEVYCAFFSQDGSHIKEDHNQIIDEAYLENLSKAHKKVLITGNAVNKLEAINSFSNLHFVETACNAEKLIALAHQKYDDNAFENLAYYEPFYLKPANITTPKKLV